VASSFRKFRLLTRLLAILLGVQCIWLLLVAAFAREIDFPTNPQAALGAARERNPAALAAFFGVIRGELWAQSAFAFSDLLWDEPHPQNERGQLLEEARHRLERAVSLAPHESRAWLLLAGLGARYQWKTPNPAEALRMAYYTAPNDLSLVAVRSTIVSELPIIDDEMQDFAERDIKRLVARDGSQAIIKMHQVATTPGKALIERVVAESDPALARSLQSGAD
jgi:hypothetical protein